MYRAHRRQPNQLKSEQFDPSKALQSAKMFKVVKAVIPGHPAGLHGEGSKRVVCS